MAATETNPYVITRDVSANDIDELGHVSNLVYVRWVLDIARAHSTALGYDSAAYLAMGAAFVVRRQEVDYKRSAMPDQKVELRTWVEDWKRVSSTRCTEIRLAGAETVLTRARTQWAFVSLSDGRPTRIPADLRDAFELDV